MNNIVTFNISSPSDIASAQKEHQNQKAHSKQIRLEAILLMKSLPSAQIGDKWRT